MPNTATVAVDRARDLELWVVLEAVESLLLHITNEILADRDIVPDDVIADATQFAVYRDDHQIDGQPVVSTAQLWDSLWPTEEDEATEEFVQAQTRSALLYARMCLAVANRPETFLEATDRMLGEHQRIEAERGRGHAS